MPKGLFFHAVAQITSKLCNNGEIVLRLKKAMSLNFLLNSPQLILLSFIISLHRHISFIEKISKIHTVECM